MQKEKLTKSDKVDIEIRQWLLQMIKKKIREVEVGTYDKEEFGAFRKTMSEITHMIQEKDAYREAYQNRELCRNKNVRKYFDR